MNEAIFDDEAVVDRAMGAFVGLAIGDALGAPVEFKRRDSFTPVVGYRAGGPFQLGAGEWTDDCSMALCLSDSLTACGDFDPHDVMRRFVAWSEEGHNSVNGRCFDIGVATRMALSRYEMSGRLLSDSEENEDAAGNGSLMRLAPAAIFPLANPDERRRIAAAQSRLTHPNALAADLCVLLSDILADAMAGEDRAHVFRERHWDGPARPLANGVWRAKERDAIESGGYSLTTLEAALWCVFQTERFEDAVLTAVNLGQDSDTVGAVAGQIAGALYGLSGVPAPLVEGLAWRDDLLARGRSLIAAAVLHAARG